MKSTTDFFDVVVVGAGISGLLAAKDLQQAGKAVLVVDKGRGVGGRLATRQMGEVAIDHGAQFMTTRNARFAELVQSWVKNEVAGEWYRSIGGAPDSHPRFRGYPTMNTVAKTLADGLTVRSATKVCSLRPTESSWSLELEDQSSISANAVVLTAPVPQTLALAKDSSLNLDPSQQEELEAIQYERCLATMMVLAGPSAVPSPGCLVPSEGPLAWVADNQREGLETPHGMILHATDAFSRSRWDQDREQTAKEMMAAAEAWIATEVLSVQVHGWRYSKPIRVHEQPCLVLKGLPPAVLAGDAFAGPRVEGAAVSGWAAAEAINSAL
ncbi:MAG: NAD(P)-binding protein [Candidatus Eisenbacteria bacterium]|uniref:NAD(P)-binding protein n=1 Tax=Eiseniibacteriota bacterium TaxID=2212470 RepID=A0A7Y2EH22_UNCEI|nr:NAD(P)-binding protein [Candidatus Eisenbacteria bacterium]